MPVLGAFPDLHDVLQRLLSDLGTVAVKTGPDLNDRLPFIAVNRVGGPDDGVTDTAVMDIDVFTPDYRGHALAETIRQRLQAGPHRTEAGQIDRVTTDVAPREIPWTDGSTTRRWNATYRMSARR